MSERIGVIVPVYGNGPTLRELHRRVRAALQTIGRRACVLFVDDAGPDSRREIEAIVAEDPDAAAIFLAQNGGQSRALLAGLHACDAEAYVIMDADLQDPPEHVAALVAGLDDAEIVFGARRGAYESSLRLATGRLFRRATSWLIDAPRDAGLFAAMSRRARDQLLSMAVREPHLVVMLCATHLSRRSVPFIRPSRDGQSSYDWTRRTRVAWHALRLAVRLRWCGDILHRPFVAPTRRDQIGKVAW